MSATGAASIYVTDTVVLRKGAFFGPADATVATTDVRLFTTGGRVRFAGNVEGHALVCAPDLRHLCVAEVCEALRDPTLWP